jgi:hypothetical protein
MSLSGILIVLLIGVASGEDCCGCWDRCFPQRLDADTELFRNMINTLRGLTIGSNIKGIIEGLGVFSETTSKILLCFASN